MRKYDVALFDLDGTIIDSGEGVTNSVKYALSKYGINVEERKELYKFIGPPLVYSFKTFYGFEEGEALRATEIYREYYSEKGIYECYVYEGIKELLSELKEKGVTVALATSKPEKFAHRVIDFLKIGEYIDYVAAAGNDEKTRSTKEEVVEYALSICGCSDLSRIVMIGDRHFDVNGAKRFGLDSIGVTFGYGSREELCKAGATYIVDAAKEITDIIL